MNEKQYRHQIDRTMKRMTTDDKLAMVSMGIAGEAGEVADYMKKIIFHEHPVDREKLIEELGDLEYYLTHLKKHYRISNSEVRQKNISKLQKRYPNGFDPEDSIYREV